ncbi:MAG TPA: Maf family protein [Pirellulales bacterium]|jgi:septum formation protein|nr:Maf family protein [Pirellulales bacterium]
MKPLLILASSSPQRRKLLEEAGYQFVVAPPNESAETAAEPGEPADQLAMRLARQKALDVLAQFDGQAGSPPAGSILVACDTVVECDGQILGKPGDDADARRMLELLSGRVHRVVSGLCVWNVGQLDPDIRLATTWLRMDPLTAAEIGEYVASEQWRGKAGGFGYQDRIGWLHIVEGSESNVIGLPLELLAKMLAGGEEAAQP